MSVTLNGRLWTIADFRGRNYVNNFPDSIFSDMLAELAAAMSVDGVSPGADGGYLKSESGLWVRSDFAEDVQDVVGGMVESADGSVTPAYNDTTGKLDLSVNLSPTALRMTHGGAAAGTNNVWNSFAAWTEQFDSAGLFNTATHAARIYALEDSYFIFHAYAEYQDWNSTGSKGLRLLANGATQCGRAATYAVGTGWNGAGTSTDSREIWGLTPLILAGQYLELQWFQSSGLNNTHYPNSNSFLELFKV